MNSLKLIFPLILVFNGFETTFVSIGNYPDNPYLNHPECGMPYKPTVYNMTFDKCTRNKQPPKTYFDTEGNNLLFDSPPQPQPQQRIYRGKNVEYGESPWTVYFTEEFIKFDVEHCTGVLISFEWVLTGAHCDTPKGYGMHVMAGSNKRDKGFKQYITKWFPHPVYVEMSKITNKTRDQKWIEAAHDIALAKLENKFEQKTSGRHYLINPICLPGADQMNDDPEPVTFFGYGLIEGTGQDPEYLQTADFELSSSHRCLNMFCAHHEGTEGPRTCPGDSGGPLVQYLDEFRTRAVLVGTLRGSSPRVGEKSPAPTVCATEGNAVSYWVAVPRFIDWILKTTNEN